jgi:hypothetical protein
MADSFMMNPYKEALFCTQRAAGERAWGKGGYSFEEQDRHLFKVYISSASQKCLHCTLDIMVIEIHKRNNVRLTMREEHSFLLSRFTSFIPFRNTDEVGVIRRVRIPT